MVKIHLRMLDVYHLGWAVNKRQSCAKLRDRLAVDEGEPESPLPLTPRPRGAAGPLHVCGIPRFFEALTPEAEFSAPSRGQLRHYGQATAGA